MSALNFVAPAVPATILHRILALAASLAFGVASGLLARRLAPQAAPVAAAALGALAAVAAAGLAVTVSAERSAAVAAALCLAALAAELSPADAGALEPACGVLALALAGAIALWLAQTTTRRSPSPAMIASAAAAVAAIGVYALIYVVASRDLMIADFVRYRELSVAVASLARSGRWQELIAAFVASIPDDYSWAPALAPGLVMAASAPLSRYAYEAPLVVFYAAPALVALAALARDLARRAGLPRDAAPIAILMLAAAGAFAAFPTGIATLARGMPDIGGLALYVTALRLGEKLLRLLALPPGHDARVGRLVRRVALALALSVFAMVLFRRWYAFAALGVAATLAAEVGAQALRGGRAFRRREAIMAASLGLLSTLVFLSPAIVAWLPDPAAHDYAAMYAPYRKPNGIFVAELLDWCGWAVPLAAAFGAALLFARSTDRRLLRLTIGAAAVATAAFLRIQTPYVHHLYLIAPALTALVGAPLLLIFARRRVAALSAVAALAAATLTPLAAWAPPAFAPTAGRPHPPRADLAELARLKAWVEARARPDNRVCGLGSSYTFSGQLIEELWQLDPVRSPFYADARERPSVTMSNVDTVDGPPNPELATCAIMVVGDPAQTHLDPDDQQTVVVPTREMLAGEGIGAHYRRAGEVFHLDDGVEAVAFERTSPFDDADMAALAGRWRAARARVGGLRGEIAP
jgi:hypothetical protein